MGYSFDDIAHLAAERLRGELFTAEPGRVEARNGGFVDVTPMTRRALDTGEGGHAYEDLPIVPNVPIAFPSAGAIGITWPVPVGAFGVLLHLTHATAEFRRDGVVSSPGDLRTHHLAHAVFLPLFPGPDSAASDAVDMNALVLAAPEIRIGSKDATNYAAMANLVKDELDKIVATLATGSTPIGGGTVTFGTPYTSSAVASSKVRLDD